MSTEKPSSSHRLDEATRHNIQEWVAEPRAKKFDDVKKKIEKKFRKATHEVTANSKRALYMMNAIVSEKGIFEPIKDLEIKLQELQTQAIEDGKTLAELREVEKPYYERLNEIAEFLGAEIDSMDKNKEISAAEMLAHMDAKTKVITEILSKPENRDIEQLGNWITGGPIEGNRSRSSFKPKAYKIMSNVLENEAGTARSDAVYFYMSLMQESELREFLDKTLKNKTELEKRRILIDNAKGRLKAVIAEEYVTMPEEEIKRIKNQNKIALQAVETVKYLKGGSSYGSRNIVAEFTLKKGIIHGLAPLMMATTVLANVGVATFSGGKFNKPDEIVSNIVKNPSLWKVAAFTPIVRHLQGKETIFTKEKEGEIDNVAKVKELKDVTVLSDFVKQPAAASVLAAYAKYKLDKKGELIVTSMTLKEYLEKQKEKPQDKRAVPEADYDALIKVLGDESIGRDSTNEFVKAYNKLNISTNPAIGQRQYDKLFKS